MHDIRIGTVILDKGANPSRIGIVVESSGDSFTISHLKEFLSFENEHRWHLLSIQDTYEYEILYHLPSTDNAVVELEAEFLK